MQPVVNFVNDNPRVEGRNILVDVHTQPPFNVAVSSIEGLEMLNQISNMHRCGLLIVHTCTKRPFDSNFILARGVTM